MYSLQDDSAVFKQNLGAYCTVHAGGVFFCFFLQFRLEAANSKGQGSKPQCPDSIPVGKDGLWMEVLRIETEAEALTTLMFTQYPNT